MSIGWKLLERMRKVRLWLAPRGSRRERYLRWVLQVALRGGGRYAAAGLRRLWGALRESSWWVFHDAYTIEDNSRVVLYTDNPRLFRSYRPRRTGRTPGQVPVHVSLVATVRNERDSVMDWAEAVFRQQRRPDEIVVVDGGSTDGTLELLQDVAQRSPVPMRVLVEAGANIARGRNVAIAAARGPVIAVTDFGCRPRPDWLERLVRPFEQDPETQVVAGWYEAVDRRGRTFRRRRWPQLSEVMPSAFIPSSRSLAFTKEAWEAAGRYPEWLTLTGEDTYFALELKRCCPRWAFVPEAVVEWYAPDRLVEFWRKIYQWSIGDGESGVLAHTYGRSCLRVLVGGTIGVTTLVLGIGGILTWSTLWGKGLVGAGGVGILALGGWVWRRAGSLTSALWEGGAEVARVLGFWKGFRRRSAVRQRRLQSVRGTFLMLSGVPIDDTGGGARCTQMTLELLRRGFRVIFVHRFPKYESVELNLKIRHPYLEVYPFQVFSPRRCREVLGPASREKPMAAVVEFPVAEFVPIIEEVKAAGGAVVYDLLDDWETSLGAAWYDPSVERQVIARSDVLVATAPVLQERLQRMAGRPVLLLPNAVNTYLFDRRRAYRRPEDLPKAEWVILYVGALWGEWFDWELVRNVALTYPRAAVVLIGDYRGQCPAPPCNLHFLGLKPQRDLPAYLAYADVTIIPWKVNAITRATSPLKVYEYVAMGKPVVAPDLPTLADIPLVLRSPDAAAFIANIERARGLRVSEVELDAFVRDHSWSERISRLLEALAATSTWRERLHASRIESEPAGRPST